MLQLARNRAQHEEASKRAKLDLEQRHIWLSEYEKGLITKDEYRSLVYGKPTSPSAPRSLHPLSRVIIIEDNENSEHPSGSDDFVGADWSM